MMIIIAMIIIVIMMMMPMIVVLEKNKFAFGFQLFAAGFWLVCFPVFVLLKVFPPKKLGIDISLIDLFFNFV